MGRILFPQYRRGRDGITLFRGTILQHARKGGVEMASECGGLGQCGRCVVRIEKGSQYLSDRTAAEGEHALEPDERLACQAEVARTDGDIVVLIKDFGEYTILSEGVETETDLEPAVNKEGDRVVHASGADLGPYEGKILGLAVDVGTTTLVMQVVDLEDGRSLGTVARKNPQISFGNDVISRISHTMTREGGLQEMQASVVRGINESLQSLDTEKGPIRKHIYEVVGVGNSTMRSIFMGQPVDSLGVIPFEPVSREPVTRTADEIGLAVHPRALVYGPPLIGGHAGADALADVLASGMYRDSELNMLIDIGTNGEVAIGNKDKIMTCSCAAGGAYEGATTRCGTGAIAGAIKNIAITDGHVEFETIGGKPPVGVCGSGLIDLLAELLRSGIMTRKAKIRQDFSVTDTIAIDQQDIYQLITAKAGLRLDQDLLIQYYGVALDELTNIYLAGAFGNFINPASAVAIGLLPPAPEKVVRIGNAALTGARQMLVSRTLRRTGEDVARAIEHVKPNEREPDFAYMVADKMYF